MTTTRTGRSALARTPTVHMSLQRHAPARPMRERNNGAAPSSSTPGRAAKYVFSPPSAYRIVQLEVAVPALLTSWAVRASPGPTLCVSTG